MKYIIQQVAKTIIKFRVWISDILQLQSRLKNVQNCKKNLNFIKNNYVRAKEHGENK